MRLLIICMALSITIPFLVNAQTSSTKEKAKSWMLEQKSMTIQKMNDCKKELPSIEETLKNAQTIVKKCLQAQDNEALPIAQNALNIATANKEKILSCINDNKQFIDKLDKLLVQTTGILFSGLPYYLSGTVQIKEGDKWKSLKYTDVIKDGTTIRTSNDAKLELLFSDGCKIKVNKNTTFTFKNSDDKSSLYELLKGEIFNKIDRYVPPIGGVRGQVIEQKTPTVVVTVRGTEYSLRVDDNNLTHLIPVTGTVDLQSDSTKKLMTDEWWSKLPVSKSNSLDADKLLLVTSVTGRVSAVNKDGSTRAISIGDELMTGEKLSTSANSKVKVVLPGNGIAVLDENTELEAGKADANGNIVFAVWHGRFYYNGYMAKNDDNRGPKFLTLNSSTTGKSSEFVLYVSSENKLADFMLLKGKIIVTAKKELLDFEKMNTWWLNQ